MKIRLLAGLGAEYLYETGRRAGLSEAAADYFRFYEEFPVDVEVNEKGQVVECTVPDSFREQLRRSEGE